MRSIYRFSSIVLLLLSSMIAIPGTAIPRVNAEVSPYAAIYPDQGDIHTDIYLQIRGLADIQWSLYLFWDNIMQKENIPNDSGSDGMSTWWYGRYDIHFPPPNEHPLSDLGNHTIFIQTWSSPRDVLNFTLTFEITQYFPCPEYLALNATYYQLLANYTALNASYVDLQARYATLTDNYDTLQTAYNSLFAQYSTLLTNYNSLSNDYNTLSGNYGNLTAYFNSLNSTYHNLLVTHGQLQSNFNSLQGSYDLLNIDYSNLQGSYNTLNGHYNSLQGNYNSLSSDYNDLESQCDSLKIDYTFLRTTYTNLEGDYETLSGELTTARILNDVLIVTTLVFVALAAYLIGKRKK